MSDTPRRSITKEDLAAAAKLKAIWLAIPREKRPTQPALAEAWGDGANQSLISQYMTGRIALNLRAVMFFAHALGCKPQDIRSDLPSLHPYAIPEYNEQPRFSVRDSSPRHTALLGYFDALKPEDQDAAMRYLVKLAEQKPAAKKRST